MSRTPIAAVAGVIFILAYIAAAITLPEHLPPLHWSLQAIYWCATGLLWVIPIRWLMMWAAGRL
jgi:hypothetical protein